MATDVWGIDDGYTDVGGTWRSLDPASRDAFRVAMRCTGDRPPDGPRLLFVAAGDTPRLTGAGELRLEDGTELGLIDTIPPDLPIGWHEVRPLDGGAATTLAVHPTRATLPPELRAWLWAVQLYALRSHDSWGVGDLGDLASFGDLARASGAALTLLNPLFDARTEPSCEASPYFPSSRRWLHPIWLRIEQVPGAGKLAELPQLVAAGRALNHRPLIDRDEIWSRKRAALDRLWTMNRSEVIHDPAFVAWRDQQGDGLVDYARHRALGELHGPDWHEWPARLHDPTSAAVAAAASDPALADRVAMWTWVQWLLDGQLAEATAELPVMADLPVGVDPGGADSWRWQHVLADGVRIGAPPDALGPLGQDWGVAPFVPWALRAVHYQPLVEVVRAVCARSAALRIDHVMGLFRLFWVPPGATPADGGYVRFPGTELLDVVLLEAARTGTVLVGEDLGTVEPGVREVLADRAVLGTRLVWFEDDLPADYPRSCLASISTHDLPTVTGLLSGEDALDATDAGVPVVEQEHAALRRRLLAAARPAASRAPDPPGRAADHDTDPATVTAAAVRALASGPAALVAVSIDDALGAPRRPNVPGTTTEQRPNWSIPLPVPLEEIRDAPLVDTVASVLRRARPR